MASGDVGYSSNRMDWETNLTPATKVLTTQTGSFAAITELVSLLSRFELHSKIQAMFKFQNHVISLFLYTLTCISGPVRWTTLLSVVNHSTKYPSPLPAEVACLKDARSGNQDDASGPATTPPAYILDPPHFIIMIKTVIQT